MIPESDKIPHSKEFDEETNKKQNSLKINDQKTRVSTADRDLNLV